MGTKEFAVCHARPAKVAAGAHGRPWNETPGLGVCSFHPKKNRRFVPLSGRGRTSGRYEQIGSLLRSGLKGDLGPPDRNLGEDRADIRRLRR
jgi:hypothetical protein